MRRTLIALSFLPYAVATAVPAAALSSKECSTKYAAAKQAGTLGSVKWNDFRKAQCGPEAAPAPAAATAPNPMAPAPTKTAAPAPAPVAKPVAPAPAPMAAKPAPAPMAGPAVFPRAVDPKYSSQAAGKGRMQTCLDQYNANKVAANGAGNGGMKWIEKGGGYYSNCNKALKG
ncbi:hypothetical protein G3T14_10810 [Methylobacterium sp. BTF04]|uniref:hypothetical protein n=1 Tax=Methylobacterium sp. BTF04 TaxID=2708300 RepID=UPI0013D22300|nr:hypothetical protein [Methylobacterium sp. BTF04]NEU12628.1 hypothetical protein [Methylobacterium sp. BTF04]